MTITITLPGLPTLGRAVRTVWPLAIVALPVLAEAAGASLLVRLVLEIAIRMADHAIGQPDLNDHQ